MSELRKIKPSLPKGTRDFLPTEVARRNYIFDTIRMVFHKYGYQQIETPAFERLETLTGKYGEEGDRLLFKILNSGDYLKDVPDADLQVKNSNAITRQIADKGLRYDLTVPLARYVVQHQSDLVFPFKRYHIGPVWRADRPQKGRYQEFYQCDADVIGSTSLINEVELSQIFHEAFTKLQVPVAIRISHRGLLEALAVYAGCQARLNEMTTAIDKMDKIGIEGAIEELTKLGWDATQTDKVKYALSLATYAAVKEVLSTIPTGQKAIEDLDYIFSKCNATTLTFDLSLARGLNYYTGTIWEVTSTALAMGSIGAGGRYDNLTEMFGGRDMSGVGISFGIERIYDVMEELNLFPDYIGTVTQLLFVHFDEVSEAYAFEQLQKVRAANIPAEIYPGKKKLDKQMSYANDKKIPYVVVVGGDEMTSGKLTFKDMKSGIQQKLTIEEIIGQLK